ncbi:hypothetical protein K4K54_003823 [Colletotrichum sp. SAR 10_86]|nr:hypothetical protein K4K54_003823 [Colletotrichum sp. SAR 10_86]KAJ5002011.1 hypothetical protein K4K48_000689 [Colletotrichum sp. SAR 10_66]
MASKPVPPTPSIVATPSGSEADRLYGNYRDGGIRSPHTTRRLNKYAAKYPSPRQGPPANQYQNQPTPVPPPQHSPMALRRHSSTGTSTSTSSPISIQFASPTPSRQPAQGQVHDETAIDTPKARMESLLQQFKEGMEAAMHADFEMRKIVYKQEFQ